MDFIKNSLEIHKSRTGARYGYHLFDILEFGDQWPLTMRYELHWSSHTIGPLDRSLVSARRMEFDKLEFDEEKENLMRCQDGLVILLRIENS